MRPILAIIPQLPAGLLMPLLALTCLAGIAAAAYSLVVAGREARGVAPGGETLAGQPGDAVTAALTPLFMAAVAAVVLVVWSRSPIKLHSYGLFLVTGFFVATWYACLEAQRSGYSSDVILDMALPMLGVTVAMCRLLYVVLNWSHFHTVVEMFRVWDGGLSFHGIIPGSFMVIGYYSWKRGMSFWQMADLMAPSVFIGYCLGRMGCFFNGCCYGHACSLPWAMRFPDENHPGLLTPPSHPAQLYSAAMALGLFFVMQRAKLLPRFNRFPGQLSILFLALSCVERIIMEIFRAGATAATVLGTDWLTQAQFGCLVGLGVLAALWALLARRAERRPTAVMAATS